ncbi:MAG: hypothetical protein JWM23_1033 [Microbacteriaceae bacterium]|nr:hypothetical protein [Microbacteriaceae bacterium]
MPFTVVNRPVVDGHGRVGVTAARRFRFLSGERVMSDAITATALGLVDVLGAGRHCEAALAASVVDGALHLDSTRVAVRVGRLRVSLPRFVGPRVHLTERFDDATDRQQVTLVVDVPVIGRVYEYAGSFRYEIRPGEGPS